MNSSREVEELVRSGQIKKCPRDPKAVRNLINRAYKDLATAKRNLSQDQDCSYNYAYNAMLRSGLALMLSQGFRPEIKDKHLIVVRYASAALGEEFKRVILDYDSMRRKRHRFLYEPDIPCSLKEAKDALSTAEGFVGAIARHIRSEDPQMELGL